MAKHNVGAQPPIDYDAIAQLDSFKALVRRKNSFLWSMTILFLGAYMLLPVLTSFTTVLHQKVVGDITLVWFYSFALFIMTWSMCHLYVAKANNFDKAAKAIIAEYQNGGAGR